METGLTPERQPLLNLLSRYPPVDGEDAAHARRIEAFVKDHPACFHRSHHTGHITGSAWLVDESGEKVLLTHHRKLNKWLQLGGHADGNSDVLSVAIREAKEESGLTAVFPVSADIFDVDVHVIPERTGEPEHLHYDVRFALQARGSEGIRATDESHQIAWVPLTELESVSTEPSLLRMRGKWLSRRADKSYSV